MPGTSHAKEENKPEPTNDAKTGEDITKLSNQNLLLTTDRHYASQDRRTEGSDDLILVKLEAQGSRHSDLLAGASQLKHNLDNKLEDYLVKMDPLDQGEKQANPKLTRLQ